MPKERFFKKRVVKEMLVALAFIAGPLLVLVFLGLKIGKITASISENIQDVLDRAGSIRLISILENQYATKGERYLQVLENVIPSKDALIDLQKEFQSLAAEGGVGFGFTFLGETPTGQSNLGAVTYRMNIKGENLEELFGFIKLFQGFKYLSGLNSVVINKPDATYQMILGGQTYYR